MTPLVKFEGTEQQYESQVSTLLGVSILLSTHNFFMECYECGIEPKKAVRIYMERQVEIKELNHLNREDLLKLNEVSNYSLTNELKRFDLHEGEGVAEAIDFLMERGISKAQKMNLALVDGYNGQIERLERQIESIKNKRNKSLSFIEKSANENISIKMIMDLIV